MKSYQPSTPRTAFGFLAAALTVVTFSLSVVAPVTLVAQVDSGASAVPTVTAGTITRLQSSRGWQNAFRSRRPLPDERLQKGRAHPARPFAFLASTRSGCERQPPGSASEEAHLALCAGATNAFNSAAIRASEGLWMYIMWPDSK